jgi:serine/threonine protein kinase
MYRCVDESCLTSVLGQESAVIGRGSFGTCVIKIFSGIPVVVKQIHRRTLKQRHTLQEAHLLQLCSGHPNLAYLYGVCTPSGSHPQLVTAFYSVAGKPLTLSAGCYKLNLSDVQIANIMLGILDGLSHIHSRNILHNDIKGNNIVLSDCANLLPSIRPIIIDFNKAAPFKAAKMYKLTEEDKVIYRKRFTQLAPDLIDGLVKQSTATDVYSFGVMAEELIGCTQKVPMMTRCTTYYSNDRPTISTIIIRIKEYLLDK